MKQPVLGDLFVVDVADLSAVYPEAAGFKRTETSQQAAASVNAETLRGVVLTQLALGEATADEVAQALGIDRLSIRPRLSELRALGKVYDTHVRRTNASGHRAIVWGLIR